MEKDWEQHDDQGEHEHADPHGSKGGLWRFRALKFCINSQVGQSPRAWFAKRSKVGHEVTTNSDIRLDRGTLHRSR